MLSVAMHCTRPSLVYSLNSVSQFPFLVIHTIFYLLVMTSVGIAGLPLEPRRRVQLAAGRDEGAATRLDCHLPRQVDALCVCMCVYVLGRDERAATRPDSHLPREINALCVCVYVCMC